MKIQYISGNFQGRKFTDFWVRKGHNNFSGHSYSMERYVHTAVFQNVSLDAVRPQEAPFYFWTCEVGTHH